MSWFSLSKEEAQGVLLKGVMENNVKKIDKALKAGADINYSYSPNELFDAAGTPNAMSTAIYVAVYTKRQDIALALLERGANPLQKIEGDITSAIHYAANNDMDIFINAVVAHGYQLKDLPPTVRKPIFGAAFYNSIKATQALLAAGEDINCYDRERGTPLTYKLRDDFHTYNFFTEADQYVAMLLDAGADLYPITPGGKPLFDTITPRWHHILIDAHLDKLRKNLTCEPGAGIDPQRLLQDGKPTTELLHYCGARMLPELFSEHRWKGKGGEGLALLETIKAAIPDYYKPMLETIDLTPLRREAAQKNTGPAVTRYVRPRPATPEAER